MTRSVESLPFSVIRKLTQYLDRQSPEHHNWMSFLEHAEKIGVHYSPGEVANFQSIAHRAVGSPSDAIFQDFITRSKTSDDVYIVLKEMGHAAGMKILKDYVSPLLLQTNEPRSNGLSDTNGSSSNSMRPIPPPITGPYYAHPSLGPVPISVPQTHIQTTVLRVQPGGCGQMGHGPHCTCMSDPYHSYSPHGGYTNGFQYPSHQGRTSSMSNSSFTSAYLGHSDCYYGNQVTTPPTQFASPPPPPYSPQGPLKIPPCHNPEPSQYNRTDNGCGPLPTLPLSPDEISSLPKNNVPVSSPLAMQHPGSQYSQSSYSSGQSSESSGGSPYHYTSSLSSDTSSSSTNSSQVSSSIYAPSSPLSSPLSNATSQTDSPPFIAVNGMDRANSNGTVNNTGGSFSGSPHNDTTSPDILGSILNFKYSDLSDATRYFTEGLIGHGAFGSVFKATVRGCGPYAIKKLHNKSEMESEGTMFYEPLHQESFMLELQSLIKYKNRNILSLVAISNDGPRPCLIYEYMENGSLADCLQGKRNVCLSWRNRLDIAGQIADALNFLHTVNHPHCLVHGDVKSSNILLDQYNTPKLSDFGLAKECHSRQNNRTTVSRTSRVAMGTVAYMAPELLRNGKPSAKTDVYAFGVVMLELYTGKPADDPARQTRALVYYLQPLFTDPDKNRDLIYHEADERAAWIMDTGLGFFDIATFCLVDMPRERSPMDQVRDQIFKLKDEADAMVQQLQNLTISQGAGNSRWN